MNVFVVWYNFLDYKFQWSPLDIAFFFSAFGLALALVSGVIIRFLVPAMLSETQAVMLGLSLQVGPFLGCFMALTRACAGCLRGHHYQDHKYTKVEHLRRT